MTDMRIYVSMYIEVHEDMQGLRIWGLELCGLEHSWQTGIAWWSSGFEGFCLGSSGAGGLD